MGRITERKDFSDENLRELGFEVILTMVEKNPKLLINDQDKLVILVEAIYKYALEMDTDIDEEWMTPKADSYFDEEYIPETKLAAALSLIDRLTNTLGSELMLRLLSDIVLKLLSNGDNWQYKYIGYMTIGQMSENIEDITHVDNILPKIFADSRDNNPKIRYACLHCISLMGEHLKPQFQNNYHDKVFPVVLERINDNVLRVQLQACDALQIYLEGCTDQIAVTYCQATLDIVFSVFLKDNAPVALKDGCLNGLCELITATEDQIKPFAPKILEILISQFSSILQHKNSKSLYGVLLETITMVGPKCEENYIKLLPDLLTAMLEIQDNIPNFTDPVAAYLQSAWERVVPIIKEKYPDASAKIIESILKLVSNMPSMSISAEPEKKFTIQELLGNISSEHTAKIEKTPIQLSTAETQDLSSCLEVLNVMIESFEDRFLPYIENTEKIIFPLLTFENDDVRIEASKVLPNIVDIIKKHSSTEILHSRAKLYISQLVAVLDKEADNACIATYLDDISEIVNKTERFLTTPELNVLFQELLKTFDKVEKSRLTLLHQKERVEDDLLKDKQNNDDKVNSDDEGDDDDDVVGEIERDIEDIEEVLVSIADTMGALFSAHKELTLDIVNKLLVELLPRYFKDNASNFEKKMGLFILDDMIEFLGQNLLSTVWTDIASIIMTYSGHKATELRQASTYGIGEFAKHTTNNFNIYANDMLSAVTKALDVNTDGTNVEEWGHARDNAVSSLGKIIKYQNANIDINTWVPKWLSFLPLTHDPKEAEWNHEFLIEILNNNPNLILGENNINLPKVIQILARIYDTKFSSEAADSKIKEVMKNIKENPQLHSFVPLAMNIDNEKTKTKIQALLG